MAPRGPPTYSKGPQVKTAEMGDHRKRQRGHLGDQGYHRKKNIGGHNLKKKVEKIITDKS